jgi:hypothetical protein
VRKIRAKRKKFQSAREEIKSVNIIWKLTAVFALVSIFSSCASQTPEEHFVRQKIPIEIQGGKIVTIEIHHLSGNGWNDIGIRCSPEAWNALTNGTKSFMVQLKSSNKKTTKIDGVNPGSGDPYFLGYVPNVHYLFLVGGEYHANATVEIAFPNAPAKIIHADIIIGKTPADTGL